MNSVDQDQMPQNVASDLGVHFLLRPFCPNTFDKYGIRCKHSIPLLQGHEAKNLKKLLSDNKKQGFLNQSPNSYK